MLSLSPSNPLCEQTTSGLSRMLTAAPNRGASLQRVANPLRIGLHRLRLYPLGSASLRRTCRRLPGTARPITACQAAGVSEAEKVEESEAFRTNDGVIEPVDDDEAEVR